MKSFFTILLITGFFSLNSQNKTVLPQDTPVKKKSVMTVHKNKQFLPTCNVKANTLLCDVFPEELTFTLVSSKQQKATDWIVTAKSPEGISIEVIFSEKPIIKIYDIVEANPSSEQVAIRLISPSNSYSMKAEGKVFVNQGTAGFYNITICGFLNAHDKASKELLCGLAVPPEN